MHSSHVVALALSCDEKFLFSVGDDGSLIVYNVVGPAGAGGSNRGAVRKNREQQNRCVLFYFKSLDDLFLH